MSFYIFTKLNKLLNWSQNRGRVDGDFITPKLVSNRELRQSLLKQDSSSKSLPNLVGQTKLSFHLQKGADRAHDQLHGGGASHAQVSILATFYEKFFATRFALVLLAHRKEFTAYKLGVFSG